MTMSALTAPHARPVSRTPTTPSAALAAVPITIHEARQLVKTNTMPTERSMPPVITTKVCAIAASASNTPLLAAVCTTLALKPAGWLLEVDREHDEEEYQREKGPA